MPWRRLVWWETENFMSNWRAGLTRHRIRRSLPARLQNPSNASIIAAGAILTAFVIIGTIALHRIDSSDDGNRWAMPLPTEQLQQPEWPQPVPVLPAPTSTSPVAVTTAPTTSATPSARRPSPPSRRPSPAAPAPVIPAAGSRISLIPAGQTGLRVRHRDFRLRVDRIGPGSSALERSDATFVVRGGLADRRCLSLESVNFPGRFVRHQNFSLFLHPREPGGGFAADATFCAQPVGPAGSFVLGAVNYPGHRLTVRDSLLRLSRVPAGDAQVFRSAAGF